MMALASPESRRSSTDPSVAVSGGAGSVRNVATPKTSESSGDKLATTWAPTLGGMAATAVTTSPISELRRYPRSEWPHASVVGTLTPGAAVADRDAADPDPSAPHPVMLTPPTTTNAVPTAAASNFVRCRIGTDDLVTTCLLMGSLLCVCLDSPPKGAPVTSPPTRRPIASRSPPDRLKLRRGATGGSAGCGPSRHSDQVQREGSLAYQEPHILTNPASVPNPTRKPRRLNPPPDGQVVTPGTRAGDESV